MLKGTAPGQVGRRVLLPSPQDEVGAETLTRRMAFVPRKAALTNCRVLCYSNRAKEEVIPQGCSSHTWEPGPGPPQAPREGPVKLDSEPRHVHGRRGVSCPERL